MPRVKGKGLVRGVITGQTQKGWFGRDLAVASASGLSSGCLGAGTVDGGQAWALDLG
jgi:hypothetical protein